MIIKKPYVIASIEKTTPGVTIFGLRAQDGSRLGFEPGMFVMLFYRDPATGAEINRAFSFASDPSEDTIDFAIAMINGRFTSKLDTAKIGDVFYVTGPYGQFKLDTTKDKKVLFIAGGTGIAPFLSMLRHIKKSNIDMDIGVIYSTKHPSEIIRKSELEEFTEALKLRLVVTVTRPDGLEGWEGEKGHIDADMIKRHFPDVLDRGCYICGPLGFIKALKAALASIGMPEAGIKADVWGE
jgi:Na+-transporting NADH:ubiquinone oxidoreductase subunit F